MGHLLTLHDPQTARRYYEAGVWRADTFYTLLAGHAARRPQDFAARDGARRLTFAELLGWVDAVADAFVEAGLRSGERVSLWLSNRLEALVAFIACARNGYVCNPSLHRNHRVEEALDLLRLHRCPRDPDRGRAGSPTPAIRIASLRCRGCARSGACQRGAGRAPSCQGRRSPPAASPRSTTTPTRSLIWPSPRARPACPRRSCIPTTRCSPTVATSCATGATIIRACC